MKNIITTSCVALLLLSCQIKAQETTKEDIYTLKQKVDTFKAKVNGFDLEAVEKIEEVESALYLNLHSNWLTNFNNKFANNYA